MASRQEFELTFTLLRELLTPYASALTVARDGVATYWLYTRHIMPNKKPLFFGAVEVKASYVSFHLMPLYVFPDLLSSVSEALRKRMQGKSCFNFRKSDPVLFQELAALVNAGFKRYVQAGYTAA